MIGLNLMNRAMSIIIPAWALVLGAAAPLAAADPVSQPARTGAPETGQGGEPAGARPRAPQAEKRICKGQTLTGSRLAAKKVCMTSAEWEAQARAAQQQFDDRRRGMRNSLGPPGD